MLAHFPVAPASPVASLGRPELNPRGVPGLIEVRVAYGETTLVVDPARLIEACEHLRDEEGFRFLSDISAADYLGWGTKGVSGYIGTASGRDLNAPMTQGYQRLPALKPKRFSVSYHLLAVREGAPRVRVQVWLDDGESLPSVVSVWPTADWHEREAFDLFGIRFDGHPNLTRILMADDWEGHPLRRDYPIGGEPVRFSGEE
jgi:NADH-quinone oxidoreductase subunit C